MNSEIKFHCKDQGSGVPVVFIHGYPLDHSIWQNQFELSDIYRFFALDLPGMGKTPFYELETIADYARWVTLCLRQKNIARYHLLGHSMGGYIALEMLRQDGTADILSFTLVNSQPFADTQEGIQNRYAMAERIEREGGAFVVDMMKIKMLSANQSHLSGAIAPIMTQADMRGMVQGQRAMARREDNTDMLIQSRVPKLIITGTDDVLVSEERRKKMGELDQNIEFHMLQASGHLSMMEKPEEVNRIFRNFLRRQISIR